MAKGGGKRPTARSPKISTARISLLIKDNVELQAKMRSDRRQWSTKPEALIPQLRKAKICPTDVDAVWKEPATMLRARCHVAHPSLKKKKRKDSRRRSAAGKAKMHRKPMRPPCFSVFMIRSAVENGTVEILLKINMSLGPIRQ